MSSFKWEPLAQTHRPEGVFQPIGEQEGSTQSNGFHDLSGIDTTSADRRSDLLDLSPRDPAEAAEKLLEEARKKAEHIEKEAFEKGYEQGERAGQELVERAMETTLQALKRAMEGLNEALNARAKQVEEEVVRLALTVARKILKREVQTDPSVILDVLRSAFQQGHLQDEIVIRVHPMDRDTIMESRAEILQHLEGVRSCRIEADESLERGDAMVECVMGELDLRLERQLQEIERAFDKILNERNIEAGG